MILNFPYLHKDEILYSGIARYFDYLNEDRIKWVTEHLFSSRGFRASVGFPSGLNNLYDNFPKGSPYTSSYLVDNHSIYPLFRPFIDLLRHEKIVNDMVFKDGKGIMTRVGAVASLIPNKRNLYYCASCIKEQMDQKNTQYLDVFWNRVHQCPGVYVCHKHREWLKQTTFSLDEINQHMYISVGSLIDASQLDLNRVPIEENKINDLHTRIAENVEWILNNNLSPRDLNYYRLRYIEYLKFKGIAKPSGRVDVLGLKELFLANYPKEFLRQLHSDFEINDEQTWVQMIIQKNRKAFHPIRHILMIMLLAENVSNFFTKEYTYTPFGSGPWDCNNPVCSRKTELISINYSRDCKQEFGDFQCECGFKERRYLSGKRKVLDFGMVWEQELVKLIQEGEGIYPISRILNADIVTIKKYAQKNNLLDKWLPPKTYIPVEKNQNNVIKVNHYNIWIDTIKENPQLNKTAIRALIVKSHFISSKKQLLFSNSSGIAY
ncbi:TnsD family transposase, partial [Bacillus sp. REN16]|uniref:TnsD family transposase n=1 Tax=Bacillus sp. REN16 TaxID=2887296 RepID=UPI001E60B10F